VRGTSDIRRAEGLDRRRHCASLGALAFICWAVAIVCHPSAARADLIGINFLGLGTKSGTVYVRPLKPTEWAGAPGVRQANWNNAEGSSGSGVALHDDAGDLTGASVTWTYAGKSYTAVSDDTGDGCLMRGYIHRFANLIPPEITVSGLGAPFTVHGYSVIIYFDGENANNVIYQDWVTEYVLAVTGSPAGSVFGKDAGWSSFDGTFVQATGASAADATAGNYVQFTGLTTSSFTLTATPVSGDGPINAIQIISAPEPASLALLVLGAVAALAARTKQSRFRR